MGRGFHATYHPCKECGTKFWSYADRRGTEGKHPKYCSRKCYNERVAKEKKVRQSNEQEGIVIRVPAKFFDDHEERECEPFCSPFKRTTRFVWLYWNDAGLDELLDDARHYSDEDGGPDAYEGSAAMRRSAAATVAAIEAARASSAAAKANRKAVQS